MNLFAPRAVLLLALVAPAAGGLPAQGQSQGAENRAPLSEVERKERLAWENSTGIIIFGHGEFFGFSRTGRSTALWSFPRVAGLAELIPARRSRDGDVSSPLAWTSDGWDGLVAAFPREPTEGDTSFQIVSLIVTDMRLLGRMVIDKPLMAPPRLRWNDALRAVDIETIRRNGEGGSPILERRVRTLDMEPATHTVDAVVPLTPEELRWNGTDIFMDGRRQFRFGADMHREPVELRKALGPAAYQEIRQLLDARGLEDEAVEGWLSTFVLATVETTVTLLVPAPAGSVVFRADLAKAGTPVRVTAPKTQRPWTAIDPSGRWLLVEEVETRRLPGGERPENIATGRLMLLDLNAGKAAGMLEEPRLAGARGGPLCMSWDGDAVVTGDHGTYLVRWSARPQVVELVSETKRNDWIGCAFTKR